MRTKIANLFDKLCNFEQQALGAEFHPRLAGREITLQAELVYFALACVFMVRPYYVQISALNYVWAAVTMVFATLTTVQVLIRKKLLRASLYLYAFCLLYVVSTALYETHNVPSAISSVGQVMLGGNLGMLAWCSLDRLGVLKTIRNVLTCYLWFDVVCAVLGVGVSLFGLSSTTSFFGFDNYGAYVVLPMLAVVLLIDGYLYGQAKTSDWVCYAACFAYKLITFSVNAIACLLIFPVVYLLVGRYKAAGKVFTYWNAVVLCIVMLVAVVVFNVQDLFAGLLEALGKGTNLSSRTIIWGRVVSSLGDFPLWGYGRVDNGDFQAIVGLGIYDTQGNHAHNLYFQMLFDVGIIGAVIYFWGIGQKTRLIGSIDVGAARAAALAGVFAFMMLGFFDGYPYVTPFYLLLGLIWSMAQWDMEASDELPAGKHFKRGHSEDAAITDGSSSSTERQVSNQSIGSIS